jgi:hypothetical protein
VIDTLVVKKESSSRGGSLASAATIANDYFGKGNWDSVDVRIVPTYTWHPDYDPKWKFTFTFRGTVR